MKSLFSGLVVSTLVLTLIAPVRAQTSSPVIKTAAVQTTGIQYMAGGVGLDARAELQKNAAAYNVLFMFAESNGEFVIPESVSVRKGSVDMLSVPDSGPLMYVSLPNGAYTVAATYKGVVRSKAIQVTGRMPDVVLTWPAQTNRVTSEAQQTQ